jgi:tetratricopeptide (TPR) repeat protein
MSEQSPAAGSVPDRLAEARALLEKGQGGEAIRLLEALAQQEPANALVHQELARALLQARRLGAAARAARRALELDPALYVPHGVLAHVALNQGQYDVAEAEYRARLAAGPAEDKVGQSEVLNMIGVLHFRQKHYDEAARLLAQALELQPQSPTMRFNLAMLHARTRQWAEAQQELEKLLALPDVPEGIAHAAHLNLGHIYARQGRYQDTRAQFDQALLLHPSFIGRLYRVLPFLARLQPEVLLRIVLVIGVIVFLIVWNVLRK